MIEKDGKLKQASLNFAMKLIQLYDFIDKKAFMKNQLARSGTSIGANIHEAHYAESPEDFIHKMGIALKECHETEYWLCILASACPEHSEQATLLKQEAGSIRRMLIATITTVKKKLGKI